MDSWENPWILGRIHGFQKLSETAREQDPWIRSKIHGFGLKFMDFKKFKNMKLNSLLNDSSLHSKQETVRELEILILFIPS